MQGNLSFRLVVKFSSVVMFLLLNRLEVMCCTPPVVNLGPNVTQCGGTITLNAGNPGSAYLWSDNSTGETLTEDSSGTYSVTVTNGPNCSATSAVTVTINPVPVVNLGPDVTHCGGNVTLDAGNGGGNTVVDQSQMITEGEIAGFDQPDLAQSFTPSASAISGASIQLYNTGTGAGNITIALYTNLPNNGGVLLASGTASNVLPGGTATVSWPVVNITPGNIYYLVFTSSNSSLGINGSFGNVYSGGIAYANAGYQPFPMNDYAFETFNATNYVWSDGSGNRQLTISTSGDYSVTVINGYNCSAAGSVNVYIKPVPVVDLGPNITECGDSVTLDAGSPGDMFRWSDGSTQQFLTVRSSNTYSVTVTDPNSSCTASNNIQVNINPIPVINLGPGIVQCGGSVTLDAENPGSTYIWNTQQTSEAITVSSSGYYSVSVTGSDNCTATAGTNVLLNPTPLLGPDKTDSICPFTTANLTGYFVTQGWAMKYSSPTPDAVVPGTYVVIATNQYGCSDTAQVTVSYRQTPDLGPDITDSICPFSTADLTAIISNPSLTINYGVTNPQAVGAGVYQISGTNASGCSDTVMVTILYAQRPNLGPDRTDSICVGTTYDLTALFPDNGYASYNWSTDTPNAVTAGIYTLIVRNATGCTDTAVAAIINREQPVVMLNLPQTSICYTNGSLTLTGGNPDGGFYRVDSTVESTFNPVAAGIGLHRVAYIFTNASGCTDSAVSSIMVHPQPFVTTTIPPEICTTTTPINLNDYFTPADGIYSGLGVSSPYFYAVITPSGQDTITDLYTDQFGCMDTSIYPVTVHQAVHTELFSSVADPSICIGQNVVFTATGAENYQFLINGNPQGPSLPVDSFVTNSLQNGDLVSVVGSNQCSSDTAGPIMFDVHQLPVVNAGPDTSIPLGSTIQLQGSATGSSLLVYQWLPVKGLNYATILNPTYSGSDSITFTLYAEDTYGCMDSGQVTIYVYVPDEIILPNVITPNGDGKNDVWKINPTVDLTGSNLVIFDRWGETVFETENYANNWGGTYKNTGKVLSDGTYYYVFKVPSEDNHVYTGAINIINAPR